MNNIHCPKCGHQQQGGEECLGCGILFDRYQANLPREDSGPSDTSTARAGYLGLLVRSLRWGTTALTVVLVTLALWQASPPPLSQDPRAESRLALKVERFLRSMAAQNPHTLQLRETELNSWLQQSVGHAQDATPAARSNVRTIQIGLEQDQLQAYLIFDFYGCDLSLLLEGRPLVQDGHLDFDVSAGWLGSLPIPRPALDKALEQLFNAPDRREQFRLPPGIDNIMVADDQLVVSYQPRIDEQPVERSALLSR